MTLRGGRRPTSVVEEGTRAQVVLLCGRSEVATWALMDTRRPDLSLVDELARLELAARRLGCSIRLRHACPELCGLVELVGLGQILVGGSPRALEMVGKPEGGEHGGVEEVVMTDDPVA